jgi:hypothetical protein
MDLGWFAVSGCVSGSAFAAVAIASSSREAGIRVPVRFDVLDIVFHLAVDDTILFAVFNARAA